MVFRWRKNGWVPNVYYTEFVAQRTFRMGDRSGKRAEKIGVGRVRHSGDDRRDKAGRGRQKSRRVSREFENANGRVGQTGTHTLVR